MGIRIQTFWRKTNLSSSCDSSAHMNLNLSLFPTIQKKCQILLILMIFTSLGMRVLGITLQEKGCNGLRLEAESEQTR